MQEEDRGVRFMRKTTLRIINNNLVLGKTVIERVPERIVSLEDYTELWGVLPSTKLLSALVRSRIIVEEGRTAQAQVIVNGDNHLTNCTFVMDFGFPVPPRIFLYGRDQVFNAAERNEHIISFNRWVRGTEKRIKNGRILFYQPESTPVGYWAVGLSIEFRRQTDFFNQKVVKEFLASLLKIKANN